MTVRVVVPLVVSDVGAIEQVASFIFAGTEQVKLTVPVKLLRGATVRVVEPDWPGLEMLMVVGLAVKSKSGGACVTLILTAEEVESA